MIIGISDQMGAQFDRLRCEVCQNLILSPINTGLLRYAVATVLTVYGIETTYHRTIYIKKIAFVATVLTVYGIETRSSISHRDHKITTLQQYLPFTVLKLSYKAPISHYDLLSCNSTYRLRY